MKQLTKKRLTQKILYFLRENEISINYERKGFNNKFSFLEYKGRIKREPTELANLTYKDDTGLVDITHEEIRRRLNIRKLAPTVTYFEILLVRADGNIGDIIFNPIREYIQMPDENIPVS